MIAARRHPSYVFPVLLIVGGALLLLFTSGVMPEAAGWRLLMLWPLLLVMAGIQLVAGRLFEGQAAGAVALVAVGLVALGGMVYVVAGPVPQAGGSGTITSSSPMTGVEAGSITVDAAGSRVNITTEGAGEQLYRANVSYSGSRPGLTYQSGSLHLTSGPVSGWAWGRGGEVFNVAVSPSVPWTVTVNGAGVTTHLDLTGGSLGSFTVNGVGATNDLRLSAPSGRVPISVAGVGATLTVTVPPGTQYRTTAEGVGTSAGGAGETPGWAAAGDRYDLSVSGVGSRISVQERSS